MAANIQPVFPATPVIGVATLTAATAVTSRANIVGSTNLMQLLNTSTNGTRVDAIAIKAKGTSVAANVFLWIFDGTTSYLFDEFDVPAVTAGNTTDSLFLSRQYANLVLPPTYKLYISETVQTDLTAFAFGGTY